MFDGAVIREEKWMGLTKSIMAIKSELHQAGQRLPQYPSANPVVRRGSIAP